MATLGSLAVGSKIKIPHSIMGDIIFLKADKDHSGYPTNATTLITENIIYCRAFDAREPNNTDLDRKNYGNNKYSESNIDQWLNSEEAPGAWYSARHITDCPPSDINVVTANPYETDAGFLNGFDAVFVSSLMHTTIKVALNTVTDGGDYETINRRMFLASSSEVGLSNENGIAEGSPLALFSAGNSSRIAYVAESAALDDQHWKIGEPWCWYLRTPVADTSYKLYFVSDNGLQYPQSRANSSIHGPRPLCNLDSDILVSDTTDNEGCYTLCLDPGIAAPTLNIVNPIYCDPTYEAGGIKGGTTQITWGDVIGATGYILERSVNNGTFTQIYSGTSRSYTETILSTYQSLQYRIKASVGNKETHYSTSPIYVVQDNFPPFISGDETHFGEMRNRFSYNYTVYDGDDVSITVEEYLNHHLLRTYTTNTGVEQTFQISSEQWGGVFEGDNYIKIVAKDDNFCVTTQTKHFTKPPTEIGVAYSPTGNMIMPAKAINVEIDLEKPFLSEVIIYASNNGNDTQPVFDDITTAVRTGVNHFFSNTAKETGVDYWRVVILIAVYRNDGVGDIKLKGVRVRLDCEVE